ncbi:MAG: four helix bundle protein [Lentisphaerae bacterium]|nr:four helix bundle protein [Lentisphaerota bacterium]
MNEEKGGEPEQPRDLKERTEGYALRIIRLYSALPKKDEVAQTLGRQLLRSGTSVGANYREANRGRSKAEFIAKMGDSLKELDESDYWLGLLLKANVMADSLLVPLIDETNELMAIFCAIIKKTRDGLR